MDRLERKPDSTAVMKRVLAGWQAGIWTALPGVVEAFDAARMVCSVTVALQMKYTGQKGATEWKDVPLLTDCPVLFPGGGNFLMTFPVKPGDPCLIIFASRCIDSWWENGGKQNQQAEMRMHDLSDGFVLVGVRDQQHLPGGAVSTDYTELRNDAGDVVVRLRGSSPEVEVEAPGVIRLHAPTILLDGDVHVTGTLTSDEDVFAQTVSLHEHVHVKGGGTSTLPPTT